MNRAISVFGLGYVGTVTAACFAHMGHDVMGVDLSPGKVEAMAAGRSPIVEPRVELGGEALERRRHVRAHAVPVGLVDAQDLMRLKLL